jgi:hypothetical protein
LIKAKQKELMEEGEDTDEEVEKRLNMDNDEDNDSWDITYEAGTVNEVQKLKGPPPKKRRGLSMQIPDATNIQNPRYNTRLSGQLREKDQLNNTTNNINISPRRSQRKLTPSSRV